jgi:hypothetical protein
MPKAWLKERWETILFPAVIGLTVADEQEIARVCEAEKDYFRARFAGKSPSSLKEPMSDTRNKIRELAFGESTRWLNPRTKEYEHILLKYMNWSDEEWAAMNAKSTETFNQRSEEQKYIDNPDAVVEKALSLLRSADRWDYITVGLAVCTGRRIQEILKEGEFFPKTAYSVLFKGQLKKKDVILPPYEIPTLVEASAVLDALARLRGLLDCSAVEGDQISSRYGPDCAAAADFAFTDLVPARAGGNLYTHLFRAVYGRIATFYYCPPEIMDLRYMAHIYGHYWVLEATGEKQANYNSTMHYSDYQIGDSAILAHGGKRQGVRLGAPGVEVLEAFKKSEESTTTTTTRKGRKVSTQELKTEKASQTGFSMYRPKQDTKLRLDRIGQEAGARIEDDTLRLLCDEHYELQQIKQVLAHWGTSIQELNGLLDEAATDAKKDETPVTYLRGLAAAKKNFKKSYEKRHQGKDYSQMSNAELKNTRTTGASLERWRRAVDEIIAYNTAASMQEARWFINPAEVKKVAGGKAGKIKAYLATRDDEIQAHHKQYGITPAFNKKGIKITERINLGLAPDEEMEEEIEETEDTEETQEQEG